MSEKLVELTDLGNGIIQIKMQDKANKNTFTPPFAAEIIKAFETVRDNEDYKVVILTGYDSYFCSGGSQDALLYLSEGKGKFSDTDLYSLSMNCPIPVIAAMQGHGIGGGFAMGMFADFVVLGRECIYTTNFMKYGFTPGMGCTFILPEKIGISLAQEMMLTAKTYRGEELQKRGIPFPVLPRAEIMDYALDLAKTLAEKPRISLVTLKDHLVAHLREGLPKVIDQEIKMHEKTFHRPEVKEKIKTLFGQ